MTRKHPGKKGLFVPIVSICTGVFLFVAPFFCFNYTGENFASGMRALLLSWIIGGVCIKVAVSNSVDT